MEEMKEEENDGKVDAVVVSTDAVASMKTLSRLAHIEEKWAALWRRQEQINAVSLLATYGNWLEWSRTNEKVQAMEGMLEQGRNELQATVISLQNKQKQLDQMYDTMNEMDLSLTQQSEEVIKLRSSVSEKEQQLGQRMEQIAQVMAEQKSQLVMQQQKLCKLSSRVYSGDLVVDCIIFVIGSMASRNGLLKTTIRMLLYPIWLIQGRSFVTKHKKKVGLCVEWAIFCLTVYSCRKLAVKKGLHQSIGSYSKYIRHAAEFVVQNFTRQVGW